MLGRVQTIIFKTIGTDSPQAYSLRKIYSPAPPFQCCVPIFILFQAATVSACIQHNNIDRGGGRGGEKLWERTWTKQLIMRKL